MRRPLVALLFTSEFHAAIESGERSITIREGLRAYQVGELVMLCCHVASWCRMAVVTRVEHRRLRNVNPADLEKDGFVDHVTAVSGMKKFYSNIDLGSDVTVVEFEIVAKT